MKTRITETTKTDGDFSSERKLIQVGHGMFAYRRKLAVTQGAKTTATFKDGFVNESQAEAIMSLFAHDTHTEGKILRKNNHVIYLSNETLQRFITTASSDTFWTPEQREARYPGWASMKTEADVVSTFSRLFGHKIDFDQKLSNTEIFDAIENGSISGDNIVRATSTGATFNALDTTPLRRAITYVSPSSSIVNLRRFRWHLRGIKGVSYIEPIGPQPKWKSFSFTPSITPFKFIFTPTQIQMNKMWNFQIALKATAASERCLSDESVPAYLFLHGGLLDIMNDLNPPFDIVTFSHYTQFHDCIRMQDFLSTEWQCKDLLNVVRELSPTTRRASATA